MGYADINWILRAFLDNSSFRKLRFYSTLATQSPIATHISSGSGACTIILGMHDFLHHTTKFFQRPAQNLKVFSEDFRTTLTPPPGVHPASKISVWSSGLLLMHSCNKNGFRNFIIGNIGRELQLRVHNRSSLTAVLSLSK